MVLPEMQSESTTSATSGDGSGKENLTVQGELASSVIMGQSDKSVGNSAGDAEPGSLVSSPVPVGA